MERRLVPADGLPLRYCRRGQGYVVYSCGPDLADNGGIEDRNRNWGQPGFDVCVVVER